MQQFAHPILTPWGLHLLPAHKIARTAKAFAGTAITVSRGSYRVDGAQLGQLLKLRARQGDTVLVTADGPLEAAAIQTLQTVFQRNL